MLEPAATIAATLGIAAALAVPATARAQNPAPPDSAAPQRLAVVEVGDVVRVFAEGVGVEEGRVGSPWPAPVLRLEGRGTPGEDLPLPVPLIDSLSIAVDRGKAGAFLGGAIGAGLGLLVLHGIGTLACEAADNQCDSGPDTAAWIGFALGGAVLGAGIGWVIGRDNPRWDRVYP